MLYLILRQGYKINFKSYLNVLAVSVHLVMSLREPSQIYYKITYIHRGTLSELMAAKPLCLMLQWQELI